VDVPGGKGCNQAIACAKLSSSTLKPTQQQQQLRVAFLGQFGNDAASQILQSALTSNNVDIELCGKSKHHPSGRGYVMIVPNTGEVSAVISPGSNFYGWSTWGVNNPTNDDQHDVDVLLTEEEIEQMVSAHSLLQLQCEIPDLVNQRLARAAHKLHIPVILDVGGEDRRMDRELLQCCDYLIPNETELERLAVHYTDDNDDEQHQEDEKIRVTVQQAIDEIQPLIGRSLHVATLLKNARRLQQNGANNVLVTLGSHGSILVKKDVSSILYQPSCPLPSAVVDETGAGDCYRAGFAVALLQKQQQCGSSMDANDDDEMLLHCMKFGSAAGALAVTKKGAVPSIPTLDEVEALFSGSDETATNFIPRGGAADDDDFPFLFGSRINSMKDRLDLVSESSLPMNSPRDWLQRQANIRGLSCVDFNYPQHFHDWEAKEAKQALDEVNLVAGAVCLRYPSKFARGAMNHPDPKLRREAIEITKQAAEVAKILGCNEVVVWSAYDGYDYPFQVNYKDKWTQIVEAFQECCDAYPGIKWSLEFKPTDENTRFFTVPSTGAAMLLLKDIDRPNMGLTLDMGHMLMAGENPGQSIAMVGDKLFGIQLNDGYTRLAAEDGMMFGSIHPSLALEAMYQLRQIDFKGHLYFDTFPQRTDPVKEAEYNIQRVKDFWRAAGRMRKTELERIATEHDAIGALELVNQALRES
jgi:sugar/nucleoside kinase (ribokinase family)/sugar phosphate isomerase/epimerase